MVLLVIVTRYTEENDTSNVKLLTGMCMNGKIQHPRKVKGKFKYRPENKDMVDYVMASFKKQKLRIRCGRLVGRSLA